MKFKLVALLFLLLPICCVHSLEVVRPTDDAFVITDLSNLFVTSTLKNSNFGRERELIVGYEINTTGLGEYLVYVAYLKFNLSHLQNVRKANLSLFVKDVISEDLPILTLYFLNDADWSEKTITFSNAPPPTTALGSFLPRYGWVKLDITSLVKKYKAFTLVIVARKVGTNECKVIFSSKEDLARSPRIEVELESPQVPILYVIIPLLAVAVALALWRVNLFKRRLSKKDHED